MKRSVFLTGADAAKADGETQTAWLKETEERIIAATTTAGGSRSWTVATPGRRKGKTTLLKNLARRYAESGFAVFVLTTCIRAFDADFVFPGGGVVNVLAEDFKERFDEAKERQQKVLLVDNAEQVNVDRYMLLKHSVIPFDAIFVQTCVAPALEHATIGTSLALMPQFMKTYGEYYPELETATLEQKRTFVVVAHPTRPQ